MTSCHYCSLPAVTGKGWSTGEYRDGVFEPFMGPKSQVELTLIRLNSSDFKNSTSGYIADCLHLVPPKNTKFGKIFQLCLIKTFYFHENFPEVTFFIRPLFIRYKMYTTKFVRSIFIRNKIYTVTTFIRNNIDMVNFYTVTKFIWSIFILTPFIQ